MAQVGRATAQIDIQPKSLHTPLPAPRRLNMTLCMDVSGIPAVLAFPLAISKGTKVWRNKGRRGKKKKREEEEER